MRQRGTKAMERSIYPILRLGEWLETFLDEKIRAEDFRKLAEEAFTWFEIDGTVREDDPTLALIFKIGERGEKIFDKWGPVLDSMKHPLADEGPLWSEKTGQGIEEQDRIDRMLEIPMLRKTIRQLFREILNANRPWEEVLAKLYHRAAKSFDHVVEPAEIDNLRRAYARLNETLVFSDHHMKRANTFTEPSDRKEIPWNVIISRVFFDFLLLGGGKDRFGFCEYCDRFFVVQRKHRKRFCSDICRVLASRI